MLLLARVTIYQVTREELEKVDMEIPTAFAKACKSAGCVRHISLLGSVAANANAKPSFLTGTAAGGGLYLSTKGKVCPETTLDAVTVVVGVGCVVVSGVGVGVRVGVAFAAVVTVGTYVETLFRSRDESVRALHGR